MIIRVNTRNLEDTMISFDNQPSDASKKIGKVVKSHGYRKEQQYLIEQRTEPCGNNIYFYRENQMYYRWGDMLSHSEIVNCAG